MAKELENPFASLAPEVAEAMMNEIKNVVHRFNPDLDEEFCLSVMVVDAQTGQPLVDFSDMTVEQVLMCWSFWIEELSGGQLKVESKKKVLLH